MVVGCHDGRVTLFSRSTIAPRLPSAASDAATTVSIGCSCTGPRPQSHRSYHCNAAPAPVAPGPWAFRLAAKAPTSRCSYHCIRCWLKQCQLL